MRKYTYRDDTHRSNGPDEADENDECFEPTQHP
jgi:hypothetical protein